MATIPDFENNLERLSEESRSIYRLVFTELNKRPQVFMGSAALLSNIEAEVKDQQTQSDIITTIASSSLWNSLSEETRQDPIFCLGIVCAEIVHRRSKESERPTTG